jgi:hypothetical protein
MHPIVIPRMGPDTITLEHPALWIIGVIAVVLLLLYLLLPHDTIIVPLILECLRATTSVFLGLSGYVLDFVYDAVQILVFTFEHLAYVWYLLAALTILSLCIEISKPLTIPFFIVYCLVALTLCIGLPSPVSIEKHKRKKPAMPIPSTNTHSRLFFADTRINL